MDWINAEQITVLRLLADRADRLSTIAEMSARQSGHGDLLMAARDLPPLCRAAHLIIDAIGLRLAALEARDIGWFVAANAVLQERYARTAGCLTWPDDVSEDAKLLTILYALRQPRSPEDLDAMVAVAMPATAHADRQRALAEVFSRHILAVAGDLVVWGEHAPRLPCC